MALTVSQLSTPLRSGNDAIDSLIFDPNTIANWNWKTDNENIIKYTFETYKNLPTEDVTSVTNFTLVQQKIVLDALAYVDKITGLNHVITTNANDADLYF